jgi:hypothetical protein
VSGDASGTTPVLAGRGVYTKDNSARAVYTGGSSAPAVYRGGDSL